MLLQTVNAKSFSPKSQPSSSLNRRGSKLINSIAVLINLSALQNYDQELKLFNGLPDHTLDAQSGWFARAKRRCLGWISFLSRTTGWLASARQRRLRWIPFLNRTPQLPSGLPTLPDQDLTPSKPQVSCPEIDAPTKALSSYLSSLIDSRIYRLFTGIYDDDMMTTITERIVRLQLAELAEIVQENQKAHPDVAEQICCKVLDKIEACTDPLMIKILGRDYSRPYLSNLFCMACDANNGIDNSNNGTSIRRLREGMMKARRKREEWKDILLKISVDMGNKENNFEKQVIKDSKLEKQLYLAPKTYGKAYRAIFRVTDAEGWNTWFTKFFDSTEHLINLKVCHLLLDAVDTIDFPSQYFSTLPLPDINDPSNRMTVLIDAALKEATGDFEGHREKLLDRIRSICKIEEESRYEIEEESRYMLSTWSDTIMKR